MKSKLFLKLAGRTEFRRHKFWRRGVILGLICGLGNLTPPAVFAAGSGSAKTVQNDVGWQSLGAMPAPKWDGHELIYHSSQGTLAITPVSAEIIRVRFATAPAFGWDHSYAVVKHDWPQPTVKVNIGSNVTTLSTADIRVMVQQSPLRISFANDAGKILDADDPQRGIAFAGPAFSDAQVLHADDHVYGFGEKNGQLDKRGWKLGGYNYVMWNTDTPGYDSSTDPLYVSVPFYMVVRHGTAHGIFLDNTWRSTFDVGRQRQNLLTFGAAGGDLNYYFINGPTPKQVVERYTKLTGRMPLPPRWALGFNQCRYSYYPAAKVRWIANTFRIKKIPCDVIWLDIHYQDNYKPFTWNHHRFPHPKKMIADLRREGFRVVTIVDPHPKVEKGYAPYDEGVKGNYFVKNPDGSIYEGPVWPSLAKVNPGPSAFPDFSNPAARRWWGSLYKSLVDIGVAGIWNDMDEPSVFNTPTGTMPLDVIFNNDGHPTTHREIHNVYGQLMSRATYNGLLRLRPNHRPFVLTRASFAGGQRYAAVWPGDNTSEWGSLRQSIPTLLGMGLSGFPFVGCDIGGFMGAPSAELFTRWLQVGIFYPFMRAHSTIGSPDKEPWAFGFKHEVVNRQAIDLRYELLPYIYNVMHQASQTGVPAMRPLFLEFPNDEAVAGTDDEFMFGRDLLVAPVLEQGATQRSVYLPPGDWYDYWTGRHFAGGQMIHQAVTINSIPLFVRGGGFIFRQPVVQDTDQMPGKALRVLIAPAKKSSASLYEDDGETLDYRHGDFMTREFHQTRDAQQLVVTVSAPQGTYRPAARALQFETWMKAAPQKVSLQTGNSTRQPVSLPRESAKKLAQTASGWSYAQGLLKVKCNDTFRRMAFTVTR